MPRLTVLMGAPGSGKSTYASKFPNVVTTERTAGKSPGEILHSAYKQINQKLAAGQDVVFDTTGANPAVRKAALSIAKKHGAQASLCVMDTPLHACLEGRRDGKVAPSVVRRMHADVQRQIPGVHAEGFSNVRVVRDRQPGAKIWGKVWGK
jgi:predicted kinase